MININPDSEKNTIYVKINGVLNADEINDKVTEFAKVCQQMQSNFSIVNDLSEFKSNDIIQIDVMSQLHKKLQAAFKIRKVIRVIGSSKLLLIKLLKADEKYQLTGIQYVPTMEEAKKLLN
jgi:hypothetical protein